MNHKWTHRPARLRSPLKQSSAQSQSLPISVSFHTVKMAILRPGSIAWDFTCSLSIIFYVFIHHKTKTYDRVEAWKQLASFHRPQLRCPSLQSVFPHNLINIHFPSKERGCVIDWNIDISKNITPRWPPYLTKKSYTSLATKVFLNVKKSPALKQSKIPLVVKLISWLHWQHQEQGCTQNSTKMEGGRQPMGCQNILLWNFCVQQSTPC